MKLHLPPNFKAEPNVNIFVKYRKDDYRSHILDTPTDILSGLKSERVVYFTAVAGSN